jgi:hypothetical protein
MNENDKELKERISLAAYFLFKENLPYDKLCWMLAERQLYREKLEFPIKNVIRERAAKIFFSSPPYDVLCWLIAELDNLIDSDIFKENSTPDFFNKED